MQDPTQTTTVHTVPGVRACVRNSDQGTHAANSEHTAAVVGPVPARWPAPGEDKGISWRGKSCNDKISVQTGKNTHSSKDLLRNHTAQGG